MAGQAMVTAEGGAVNSVLGKLTHLLVDYRWSPMSMPLRSKIVNLKADLGSLHAFLLSSSGKQDQRLRSWMVEAREVSYGIEDILDGELEKSDRKLQDLQRSIEKSMNLLASVESRRPINKVEELFNSPYWGFLFELQYAPSASSGTGSTAAQVPSEEPPRELVGIHALRDGLVSLLKKVDDQSGQRLRVISIVGCRGLGKKTLAKEVHRKLKEEFECAAFVEMTPNCSMNDILRKILSEVDQHYRNEARNDQQLITQIHRVLKYKRYFVVIGDVHRASSWRVIKEALPENKRSSRIMTTTCINSIANICCPHIGDFVYEMQPLTSNDCKSLFPLGDSDSELVKVYNDILNISGYTPLAVISLASVLAKKGSPRRSWEEVRNTLCTAPGDFQELKEIIKIFSHSYYELPSNLKACALYLSILPLNHKIDKDWLVRKWIAEGFVHEEMGLDLEEVAKNYLRVLVDRNFIQPVDCSNILMAERYQVHFMMLFLLKSISQQENFVTLLHAPDIRNSHSRISRRLSVFYPDNPDYSRKEDQVYKVDLSDVRSVNICGGATTIAFQKFNNVRVLDIEGCMGVKNANMGDICCMYLLKYLGLKETQVSELPQQIENLKHLETLDVRKTKIRKLPKEAVHLRKLVNLLVGDSDIHQGLELPEGIKDLRLLKVLRTIDLRKQSISILPELLELTELRELEVVLSYDRLNNMEQSDEKLSLLKVCSNLQSLVIYGDFSWSMDTLLESYVLQKLRVSRRFVMVPHWITKLLSLAQLDIRVCKLEDGSLHVLRGLPSLQRLIIGLEILPKEQPISITNTGFVSLDTFCFDCKMPWLRFEPGAMPKLKHLELKFYGGLSTQVPSGTNHLRTLRKVVLRYPQGWEGNTGIKETIDALKQEADEHVNDISMYRDGTEERFPWKLNAEKGKQKMDG